MAGELQFKCKICDAEMKETNHWFMSWFEDGVLHFAHFNKEQAIQKNVICLCGEVHCHTILSQHLPGIAGGSHE